MKTVVTGASGHIGANLVRALIAKGRQVRVLSHASNLGLDGLDIEYFKGDVSDIDSLVEAFQDGDVVYHLAAHVSLLMDDWPCCAAVNIEGTRHVIDACIRAKVRRLVHFSSIHSLCTEPLDIPIDESRPLVESLKSPPYDRSKAAGEKTVRQAIHGGLNAIIINPTAIIGPYDYRPSHLGQALLQMATGKIPVLIEGGFDWVDVRDVVEYAIKAEEIAPSGANYLLSGHWLAVKKIAEIVADIMGTRVPRLACPMVAARMCAPIVTATSRLIGTRPIFTIASLNALSSNHNIRHDKATHDLGYNPRPLRNTITDAIQWFKDNGYMSRR